MDLKSSPSPPNSSKDYWKLLSLLISINWPSLVTSWVVVQKIFSKMLLVSFTNTHCDTTDLVNHLMVKNTKTWLCQEQNIIFLRNIKILNLCFRWHIFRSYHFVAEVTFNVRIARNTTLKNTLGQNFCSIWVSGKKSDYFQDLLLSFLNSHNW